MFIFISQCIILQTSFPKLKEYEIAFGTVCSYFLVHFCKVHIFWEGHKILQNLPLTFDCMYCSKRNILKNFVVFSEYMNFTVRPQKRIVSNGSWFVNSHHYNLHFVFDSLVSVPKCLLQWRFFSQKWWRTIFSVC